MVPFTSYVSRGRSKPRLIFSRINGPIVSQPLWIFMFFFLQSSSLLFSITRSRSLLLALVLSLLSTWVLTSTITLKKTRLCCCFFFLKVRATMRFLSVAFRLPYLLIELFDIGMPVVRTDGRAGGRCTVTWFFYLWCSAAHARAPLWWKSMIGKPIDKTT